MLSSRFDFLQIFYESNKNEKVKGSKNEKGSREEDEKENELENPKESVEEEDGGTVRLVEGRLVEDEGRKREFCDLQKVYVTK